MRLWFGTSSGSRNDGFVSAYGTGSRRDRACCASSLQPPLPPRLGVVDAATSEMFGHSGTRGLCAWGISALQRVSLPLTSRGSGEAVRRPDPGCA